MGKEINITTTDTNITVQSYDTTKVINPSRLGIEYSPASKQLTVKDGQEKVAIAYLADVKVDGVQLNESNYKEETDKLFKMSGGGSNGATPEIGENGNWWINGEDTGKKAIGTDGKDGVSPQILKKTATLTPDKFTQAADELWEAKVEDADIKATSAVISSCNRASLKTWSTAIGMSIASDITAGSFMVVCTSQPTADMAIQYSIIG